MSRTQMICARCGHINYIKRQNDKGQGAGYAAYITSMAGLRGTIYNILRQAGAKSPETAIPKKHVAAILYKKGIKASGNAISGRLSELLGMGKAFFTRQDIIIHRPDTEYKPRFKHIPRWYAPMDGYRRLM